MWCGPFYLHLSAGHLPNLCAMAWIPLIFMGYEGIIETGKISWACLLVLALSFQILAGHPQYVFFTLGGGILFFALRIFQTDRRGVKTALFFGSLLFAGGLTAIQLFTGYAAEGEGLRHLSIDFKMASSFSLPLENIFTVVFPYVFGKLEPGTYWGRWYPWEVSLFVGATAFIMAFIGWTRKLPFRLRADLVWMLIVFLLALGPATPLYPFIYRWLPHANELRGWSKLDVFLGLGMAMGAGFGFDFLSNEKNSRREWTRPLAVGGLISFSGSLTVFLCVRSFQKIWDHWFFQISWLKKTMEGLDPTVRETFGADSGIYLTVSLLAGALLLGLLGLFFRLKNEWRNWGILLLCVGELFVFARMNRPTFAFSDWERKVAAVKEFCSSHPGDDRIYGTSSDSLLAGGKDLWEYEPLVLQRYGQFVASSQGLADNQLFSVMPVFSRFSPLFGLVRLRYLLDENPNGLRYQELPFPRMPRFKLLNHWEVLPGPESVRGALFAPRFDFFNNVLLEQDPLLSGMPNEKSGKLIWNEIDSDRIECRVDNPSPSILLITDNYSEGWHARPLDGDGQKSYKVLPGDYFLQAVPLGAGSHHFLLEYKPEAFSLGLRITEISIFLYLVILGWVWRRKLIFWKRVS